jgi:galactokinase
VKRRDGTSGKIQSTTRFSVVDSKVTRESRHLGYLTRVSNRE